MNASVRASVASPAASTRALVGTLLAAALLSGSVSAGEATPAVKVPYGDLNLASDAGSQALLRRLSTAAHQLCDDPGSRELRRVVRAEACYRETLDNAVVAVHNERLSTLYRVRTGAGAI